MGSTIGQTEAAKSMDKAGPQFPLLHETPQFRAKIDDFYLSIFAVINQARVTVGTLTIPMAVSWIALVVAAILCVWLWRLASRSGA